MSQLCLISVRPQPHVKRGANYTSNVVLHRLAPINFCFLSSAEHSEVPTCRDLLSYLLYFGFSAQLSLLANVSHCVRTGLFTTRKDPWCFCTFTTSPARSLCETCPSRLIVVPILTLTGRISTMLSAFITIGRKLSECGQSGVITIADRFADKIGPPAERL